MGVFASRNSSSTVPIMSPTSIAAFSALFVGVGALFLFANLMVGWFLRPNAPNAEKQEVYECGEPAIGSSFVQFDLRFYVIALLFIIFDVEIAFFFPWATVFGKATQLTDPDLSTPAIVSTYVEMGVSDPMALAAETNKVQETAAGLAWMSLMDILVFFAVLLVGFAYVWRRGDLDWVRAVGSARSPPVTLIPPDTIEREEPALIA